MQVSTLLRRPAGGQESEIVFHGSMHMAASPPIPIVGMVDGTVRMATAIFLFLRILIETIPPTKRRDAAHLLILPFSTRNTDGGIWP
jgi:ABC-type iron transport system FetAB permease component